MTAQPIQFKNGATYERFMGIWSQRVGAAFIDWLAPRSGLRWLDIGCGNGAFTELIGNRCAPKSLHGVDPSDEQLAYARTRPVATIAEFSVGDAMALPFADRTFDAAVMPLVIFFLSKPAVGVAQMTRVVAPGGLVSAYAWDMEGGGFPYAVLHAELRDMGIEFPAPPSPQASRVDVLRDLWLEAGIRHVETQQIAVQRTFADFNDYWETALGAPSVGAKLAAMPPAQRDALSERIRARLTITADGRVECRAHANAVKGVV